VDGPGDADADKHLFAQDRLMLVELVEKGCGALGAGIWGLDDEGKDDGARSTSPDATMHGQATLSDGLGCLASSIYCSFWLLASLEETMQGVVFTRASNLPVSWQSSWLKILETACAMAKIRSTDYAEQASPRHSTAALDLQALRSLWLEA